ncbi:polysaccharide deacetylase family protein [Clostridium sp.]|uniref:polysaccharide deacetylase family protein n=1 Tax=Clostridium sp. TaxID=1506 RepID=UPI001E19F815|nr:polysaccharide deacetylase family protein [Clostridium sp.]MBS5307810.1 polysaccharide deacetylase family protein [Clostridium sp.]
MLYREVEQEIKRHSASLEQNKKEMSEGDLRKISKSKSCVTIIFDDCAYYDYQYLLPILKEKNIKVGLACLTDWVGTYNANTQFMTWEQIKEFSDLGNEIVSHSIRQDVKYDTLSDVDLENYFKKSRDTLREQGYWSDLIVYTWGTSDIRIRKVARKYYRAGFAIWGQEIVQNSNGSTLNTYDIARVGLNGEDKLQSLFPSDTDSLDYLKARVDYAKANNQWLVLMGHSFMFKDTSKTKIQQFKDLIDYIKSVGIDIVIPSEGLKRMGNQIDLIANEDETKYFKLNSKGQIRSNINDVWDSDSFTGNNKLKDFRRGITITSISTAKAQTDTNLPITIGGTLVTYNTFLSDVGYQEYITLDGKRWQRWAIDSQGNFSEWLNLLPPTQYNNTNIVIPSVTVPAKTTYNYTFKLTGITQINNIALYPTTNIETGLMFTHWIMPDNTVVLRFANITDIAITTTERTWVSNSIKLR